MGDFGLARAFDASSNASLSHQVSTRWYRAPELLFASRHYTLAVDVWSAGAVLAELLSLTPLFPGNNDIDQIYRVFQIMGSPSSQSWPGVDDLPDYKKISFPNLPSIDLQLLIPHASTADITFLRTLLILDPMQRVTAQEARDCAYLTTDLPLRSTILELSLLAEQRQQQNEFVRTSSSSKTSDTRLPSKNESMNDYLQRFLR